MVKKKGKIITGVPPPQKYFFFKCDMCGQYPVSEKTARDFLTEKLRTLLDEKLHEGAVGADLTFKDRCPRCEPDETYYIELAALKPRLN